MESAFHNRTPQDARDCIASQKENQTYRGAKIGFRHRGSGRPEDEGIVLYSKYDDQNSCTTEWPMTTTEIVAQRAKGSLLTTWLPCVGVPIGLITPIE